MVRHTHPPVHVLLGSLNVPGTLTGDIPLQVLSWRQDRAIHVGWLSQDIVLQPVGGDREIQLQNRIRNPFHLWSGFPLHVYKRVSGRPKWRYRRPKRTRKQSCTVLGDLGMYKAALFGRSLLHLQKKPSNSRKKPSGFQKKPSNSRKKPSGFQKKISSSEKRSESRHHF